MNYSKQFLGCNRSRYAFLVITSYSIHYTKLYDFSKKEVTHHAVPRIENEDMDKVKEILDDYFAPFNDNLNQRWGFSIYRK